MSCGNKIKHTCAEKNYATCIYYEKEVPDFSSLTEADCITLEETTEDIYEILTEVKGEIDLSGLGEDCLVYVQEEGKNIVKNVLLKYEEEICTLKTKVEALENANVCEMDITNCGLDLTGLTTPCDEPITTLGDLLSYVLTQI